MVDYSGCRSCNTRGVFPAPSSSHRFFGVWSTPGKHFRGGTLPLSNETVSIRRLRSLTTVSATAISSAIADVRFTPRLCFLIRAPPCLQGAQSLESKTASMFELFKSEPFRDRQLGEFRRSGKHWKGSLLVPSCGMFRLVLVGSHKAPDPIALGLAKELSDRFKSLVPTIQTGMFEHYAPYKEAIDAGEETGGPCPSIANPQ